MSLELVAKYGDAYNVYFGSLWKNRSPEDTELYRKNMERVAGKLDVLKEHCGRVGRRYDDIERSVLGHVRMTPEAMGPADFVESCQELAEIGFQHVIVNMTNLYEMEPLRVIRREVIPIVAGLS